MHLRGVVGSTGPLSHIAVDSSFCLAAEKSNACRVREKLAIRLQAGVKPKIFTLVAGALWKTHSLPNLALLSGEGRLRGPLRTSYAAIVDISPDTDVGD